MLLGLPHDPELADGEVRQAYRERLRAVHPDAGGDSECAVAVTAAYDALRSPARRALAAEAVLLAADGADGWPGPGVAVTSAAVLDVQGAVAAGSAAGVGSLLARMRHGRWWLLAGRVVAAAAVPVAAWQTAPGYPAAWAALAVGSATWLVRTGRYDLAPGQA